MRGRKMVAVPILISILALSACDLRLGAGIIKDAKIVTAVDEKLMPVKEMNIFPRGTSTVSCWIRWRDAKINTQVLAKWHYVTDDIPISEHTFNIPKKEGTGSVALSMPEGKSLPSGSYKIDLFLGRHLLKSLAFKIE